MSEELDQTPIIGRAREYWPLTYELVNGTDREELWNEIVRQWHYLGYGKMIGPRVKYLIWHKEQLIGAISFIQGALKLKARDRLIGATQGDFREHILQHMINNNRFLILPWIHIKNLASRILSGIMPTVKKDWRDRYGVVPYAVETFVDITKYKGTCYKAANWQLIGETSGYEKVGKEMVYHGNKKGIFFRVIDKKRLERLTARYRQDPAPGEKPKRERAEETAMMDRLPIWDPELFPKANLTAEQVLQLPELFMAYLDTYMASYRRDGQQHNAELFIKGLLSDVGGRKNIENIALALEGPNRVRTLQGFIKDAPWLPEVMRDIYQRKVYERCNHPNGMVTIDDSGFKKQGKNSFGVAPQYLGCLGKVGNGQVGVFAGYCSPMGHGLLQARLYAPVIWFTDKEKRKLWKRCDVPEDLEFKTKPEIGLELIGEILARNAFDFQWIGMDCAYSGKEFRSKLPEDKWYFGDVRCNHTVKLTGTDSPVQVQDVAMDDAIPWQYREKFIGAAGPDELWFKAIRVTEPGEDKELWLFIRRNKKDDLRYALSNAPASLSVLELNCAADMRWTIESSFRECKQNLGMNEYETRSYEGWNRHMQLVMVAHLFLNMIRDQFTVPVQSPVHRTGDGSEGMIPKITDSAQIILTSEEAGSLKPLTIILDPKPKFGQLQVIRVTRIRFLSIENAVTLFKAALTCDIEVIRHALNVIAFDLKNTWKSICSRTKKYYLEHYVPICTLPC